MKVNWHTTPGAFQYSVFVDGGEICAVEADDVEGYAIIDILKSGERCSFLCGPTPVQCRITGKVEFRPKDKSLVDNDWPSIFAHQQKMLEKCGGFDKCVCA